MLLELTLMAFATFTTLASPVEADTSQDLVQPLQIEAAAPDYWVCWVGVGCQDYGGASKCIYVYAAGSEDIVYEQCPPNER